MQRGVPPSSSCWGTRCSEQHISRLPAADAGLGVPASARANARHAERAQLGRPIASHARERVHAARLVRRGLGRNQPGAPRRGSLLVASAQAAFGSVPKVVVVASRCVHRRHRLRLRAAPLLPPRLPAPRSDSTSHAAVVAIVRAPACRRGRRWRRAVASRAAVGSAAHAMHLPAAHLPRPMRHLHTPPAAAAGSTAASCSATVAAAATAAAVAIPGATGVAGAAGAAAPATPSPAATRDAAVPALSAATALAAAAPCPAAVAARAAVQAVGGSR